jgi:hypothetical protein
LQSGDGDKRAKEMEKELIAMRQSLIETEEKVRDAGQFMRGNSGHSLK